MNHRLQHTSALKRQLTMERELAAHRVLYGLPEASLAFMARLESAEREVRRLSAENDELRGELIRSDARQLRVVR